jgi:molybdopterin converting factor subunit 1
MSLHVLFFASLSDITGMRETRVDAGSFSHVGSIFEKFAKDFPALEAYRASILIAVNSEFAQPESPVHDGDEIAFFPPVSGG